MEFILKFLTIRMIKRTALKMGHEVDVTITEEGLFHINPSVDPNEHIIIVPISTRIADWVDDMENNGLFD